MTPWCRTHGFTETAPLKHENHIPVKAYDIVPVHPRDGNGPKLIDPRAMTPRISKHKVTTASMTHAFSRAQGSRPKLPAEQQDQAEQQEQEQQSTTKNNKEQQTARTSRTRRTRRTENAVRTTTSETSQSKCHGFVTPLFQEARLADITHMSIFGGGTQR